MCVRTAQRRAISAVIVDRFRQVGKQLAHLVGRLEILRGLYPRALLLAQITAMGDADQRIMGRASEGFRKRASCVATSGRPIS